MTADQRSAPGPIEDYALLSDMRTAALVGKDGSIDWLCLPRFDSPSVFSRLLGDESHGHWRIAPTAQVTKVERRYRDTTMVLETDFHTEEGVVRLVDAMQPHQTDTDDAPAVVRTVIGISGEVTLEMRWVLRFAYGDSIPWVRRVRAEDGEYILAVAGPSAVTLHGDLLPYRVDSERAHGAEFTLDEGEQLSWALSYCPDPEVHQPVIDPAVEVDNTERWWRDWAGGLRYEGPHREAVRRSLLTLKALTYAPTGGIVAAPTTSLPETIGGERNWDYRYCWLRDATLTLLALDNFGRSGEAFAWRRWLHRALAGDASDLQIMYSIDGSRHLFEQELDWLPGYHGSAPVRVGNGAFRQQQLDVFGEVMDALQLARERGLEETPESWAMQRGLMRHLETIWQQPDKSLWEVRGEDRYFVYSRVMIWVAFDRAVRACESGLPGPVQRWREMREAMHAEVLEHGYNTELGTFTQYYGGTTVDAATLRLSSVGFLPGDDERMLGTIDAVGRELAHGDLVDRYTTGDQQGLDGLSGKEGAFLMCSFWYVDALALAGRREQAEAMFERLLGLANDVGLLAEEYDAEQQRFIGNFPQAFSHLALVNSAATLWGDGVHRRHHRDRTRAE
ncbi:glycoside hydrolase family 15 protein [Sciscionella marina]|uniref:glycoside hydrolase family 15 protein n=1 Tax=Sciscionella marina TaxID=508770 RepID=UPI00035EB7AD|nr:glycoside hydrolase family 15 protein [Sciscionella marina]